MTTNIRLAVKIFFIAGLLSGTAIAADLPGDFPQGSLRYLTYEELTAYSDTDLALMRNEIFARKGYDFSNTKYRTYFSNKLWYKPVKGFDGPTVAQMLSTVERANIYQIKFVEGQRLYNIGNYSEAYPRLLDAAEHGVVAAQNYIGIMIENGLAGTPKGSGFEWYRKASNQGDPWAANKIGEMFLSGKVVLSENDKPESPEVVAASLFALAADKGYEPAAANYRKVLDENPGIGQRVAAYTRYMQGEEESASPESDTDWGETALKVTATAVGLWALYKAAQAAAQAVSSDSSFSSGDDSDEIRKWEEETRERQAAINAQAAKQREAEAEKTPEPAAATPNVFGPGYTDPAF